MDLPSYKMVISHSYVTVYQRVNIHFPMVFLWFSHSFPIKTSIFPLFSYGFPMVFPLKHPFSYGFPMVSQLKPPFSYGFPMGFRHFSPPEIPGVPLRSPPARGWRRASAATSAWRAWPQGCCKSRRGMGWDGSNSMIFTSSFFRRVGGSTTNSG